MSDAFWNNLPATLVAIGTLVAVILSHLRTVSKLNESATKLAENTQITKEAKVITQEAKVITEETKEKLSNGLSESVEEIHRATNGMKDELLRATAHMEFAKGLAAGQLLAEKKADDKV